MNPKSAGNEIEQTEMGNAKHAKIIPGPKRQALPLLKLGMPISPISLN